MKKELKKYSFDQIKDEFIGKKGTPERDQYEYDLKMEILGELNKTDKKRKKPDPRTTWRVDWCSESSNIQIRESHR